MPNVIISPPAAQQVTEWRVERIILTPRAIDPTDGVTIIQDYSAIVMLAFINSDGTVHHYETVVTATVNEAIGYFEAIAGSIDESLIESRTAEWLVDEGKVPDSFTCPYIFILPDLSPVLTFGEVSAATLDTTSGTGPFTYEILTGDFPTGITLNTSTGALTGTPSAFGEVWAVTVRAEDAEGCPSEDKAYSGNTSDSALVTVTPTGGLFLLSVGVPYSQTFTASGTGGMGPGFNWSIDGGALPDGLSFIDGTGTDQSTIQGTPTGVDAPWPLTYTVTAEDQTYSLTGASVFYFELP